MKIFVVKVLRSTLSDLEEIVGIYKKREDAENKVKELDCENDFNSELEDDFDIFTKIIGSGLSALGMRSKKLYCGSDIYEEIAEGPISSKVVYAVRFNTKMDQPYGSVDSYFLDRSLAEKEVENLDKANSLKGIDLSDKLIEDISNFRKEFYQKDPDYLQLIDYEKSQVELLKAKFGNSYEKTKDYNSYLSTVVQKNDYIKKKLTEQVTKKFSISEDTFDLTTRVNLMRNNYLGSEVVEYPLL